MPAHRVSRHKRSSTQEDGTEASAQVQVRQLYILEVQSARRWQGGQHKVPPIKVFSSVQSSRNLRTTACWRRATLAEVLATPCLLGHRPTCLPIREARVAIIGL